MQLSLSAGLPSAALSHLAVPWLCCRQLMTLQLFSHFTVKFPHFFFKIQAATRGLSSRELHFSSLSVFTTCLCLRGMKKKGQLALQGPVEGVLGAARGAPRRALLALCCSGAAVGCDLSGQTGGSPCQQELELSRELFWQVLFSAN